MQRYNGLVEMPAWAGSWAMPNFFSYLLRPPRRCRWCGNSKIDRMPPRGTFEVLLLPITGLHVFSCHECLARYYSWRRFPRDSKRAAEMRAVQGPPKRIGSGWKKQCPSCGSDDVWRSHRQSVGERIASRFIRLWPLRCHECGVRFYRFSLRPPRKQSDKSRSRKDKENTPATRDKESAPAAVPDTNAAQKR